ncbi:ABC-F family ATP-binding cassette domain-containing protein [Virgibacillus soli]|uniref:ABC-F family ATP-binding cassette domain-containing protein n=1 Tax=Paracerasibacillus soli TaxID=480284 RepID=UPI0035EF7875
MLTVEQLTKTYGDKVLFKEISCVITERDRIGLIGVNGTGKSTFLKMIAGVDVPDEGSITHPKDYRIEYLPQEVDLDPHLTVIEQIFYGDAPMMKLLRQYEQALLELQGNEQNEQAQAQLLRMQQRMDEHEAWEANTVAQTILTKLGITDFDKAITELSGGQKKRVAMAKAFIQPADLLILDEPTNHLDHETVVWLEKYLATYQGALLLVTHDRYFLNRVTNRIYELEQGNLYMYDGNYELFLEKKAEREALEVAKEQKHANTLRRELAWLKRGAKARSTKQKARIQRVEEMQEQKFQTSKEEVAFQVGSTRLGTNVLELIDVHKTYGEKQLVNDFSYLINRHDRIGIIGPNGSGKTTLLNMMANRIKPDAGEIKIGETVKIGYYTQGEEELDGNKRVIDYIKETAEVVHTLSGDVITAEQMLERFLFQRPEQWNYIRRLSGGEKRRLYLLKILMTEPNVLFLDEPTNDLDTQTLSVLEEYLTSFPGVVITVSHDRYFLDRVIDRLFVFTGKGKVQVFFGNFSEYLETVEDDMKQEKEKQDKAQKKFQEQKPKKRRLTYKEKMEWEVIEDEIGALEDRLVAIANEIETAGSDLSKVQSLYTEQQTIEQQLEEKMSRWATLSELVEEIENQA